MDVDLLSSSDESSFDDAGIMNDVTQPHASEAKDDKEYGQHVHGNKRRCHVRRLC